MWTLQNSLIMSDLDVRLRYFLCCDLEASLRKLMPAVSVRPFGSTVNGFGRYDCDLDLVVNLNSTAQQNVRNDSRCQWHSQRGAPHRNLVTKFLQTTKSMKHVQLTGK